VDYVFIAQTNLGSQFQIDTGKLGETHARGAAVRDYAKLMDSSHAQVENNLPALLQTMNVKLPPGFLQVLRRAPLISWQVSKARHSAANIFAARTRRSRPTPARHCQNIDNHMHRVEALLAAAGDAQVLSARLHSSLRPRQ
jgi:predicted outer membrane protein